MRDRDYCHRKARESGCLPVPITSSRNLVNKEIKASKSKYYITSVSLRKVKVTPRNVVMKHHLENANDESFVLKHLKSLKASKATTSFPGSSLLLRKDPGWGWSRGTQILRAKI